MFQSAVEIGNIVLVMGFLCLYRDCLVSLTYALQ